jgi:hypothetical protein
MYREEQRDEAPDWLGPLVGLLVVLVLAGLAALLWLTIFAAGEHAEEEEAAHTQPAILRLYVPA